MTRINGYVVFYLVLFYFSIFHLIFPPIVYADDDYSFDLEAFEKKPLEWGGYLELKWEHMNLNRDGAFYLLYTTAGLTAIINIEDNTELLLTGSFVVTMRIIIKPTPTYVIPQPRPCICAHG